MILDFRSPKGKRRKSSSRPAVAGGRDGIDYPTLINQGWAGIGPGGQIVDRRKHYGAPGILPEITKSERYQWRREIESCQIAIRELERDFDHERRVSNGYQSRAYQLEEQILKLRSELIDSKKTLPAKIRRQTLREVCKLFECFESIKLKL